MWRHLENLHYQVKLGVLETEQARMEQVARALFQGGQPDWWELLRKTQMDSDLRMLMEKLAEEYNMGVSPDDA